MEVARYRTLSIMDEEGIVLKRIWCSYELSLVFRSIQKDKGGILNAEETNIKETEARDVVWGVYTAFKHTYKSPTREGGKEERQAIGLIAATSDQNSTALTAAREKHFPFDLIRRAPTIQIENGQASKEPDRIHILNSIVGNIGSRINDAPLTKHREYDKINDALRARFVSTDDRLIRALLQLSDDEWSLFLLALSKGEHTIESMVFDFEEAGPSWSETKVERAIELVRHLPPTIRELYIHNADFDERFFESVIQHVEKTIALRTLFLYKTKVTGRGEEEGQRIGERLAGTLINNMTITWVSVMKTDLLGSDNVDAWGKALMSNKTLEKLYLTGDEIVAVLKDKTKYRTPSLDIR